MIYYINKLYVLIVSNKFNFTLSYRVDSDAIELLKDTIGCQQERNQAGNSAE